ncbi:16S rRNA (cytosine(1402)-N(4))-methyltransferase RsmH [bacterium]|nr:16S rRNA (cytosine(1402)-N(4))-methyltransferase RsmH [bacterium]NBX97898.1 16S rRNA (cytosine(1402)-N(4))-methyltransferase RsmH [bacterium]NDC93862.1 16S rRNA (cytosine(1402)-N(4))-methyltransferase RsmH [bacterium]NDD82809.1 16S rRNA (cytosine(1402)-N(4))-methyltransferase RsmH [bacterium]NDG28742.1 16S rRNA (cytosine(1402)-N(4))-methyltransferase RsmH [bacterium]
MQINTPKQKNHVPVLLQEVVSILKPKNGETYLDLTAGYGGHANEILNKIGFSPLSVLVDRDCNAVRELEILFKKRVTVLHSDFLSASKKLAGEGKTFDLILADIGVSSPHLNESSRGFSIQHNGPLDMRMDQTAALSAYDVVNSYSVEQLEVLLRVYGEEPKAKKIAAILVENRPIETTHELAEIVAQAWPGYSKVHPATRTFQAIRIAVNDELQQLQSSLPLWESLLAPGGRLAVISFHSLEDRIVKRYFNEHSDSYDANLTILTKRPITAGPNELLINPRARSAKLRAVAKIKTNG